MSNVSLCGSIPWSPLADCSGHPWCNQPTHLCATSNKAGYMLRFVRTRQEQRFSYSWLICRTTTVNDVSFSSLTDWILKARQWFNVSSACWLEGKSWFEHVLPKTSHSENVELSSALLTFKLRIQRNDTVMEKYTQDSTPKSSTNPLKTWGLTTCIALLNSSRQIRWNEGSFVSYKPSQSVETSRHPRLHLHRWVPWQSWAKVLHRKVISTWLGRRNSVAKEK